MDPQCPRKYTLVVISVFVKQNRHADGKYLAEARFHVITVTGGAVMIAVRWIATEWCQHDVGDLQFFENGLPINLLIRDLANPFCICIYDIKIFHINA